MKNKIFKVLLLWVMIGTLSIIGCGDDENNNTTKTDPSFLVGSWFNAARGITFTVDELNNEYHLTCNLSTIDPGGDPNSGDAIPAQVRGNLDFKTPNLGPNDYVLRNLKATEVDEDSEFFRGNQLLATLLLPYDNLLVTLAPLENETQFNFLAQGMAAAGANMFFGGRYIKQP